MIAGHCGLRPLDPEGIFNGHLPLGPLLDARPRPHGRAKEC